MAVALATLPLKSRLAGDGDTLLTTGAGAGLATGLAESLAGFAGLLGLLFGFVTGLTACFATGLADLTTFLLGTGLAWGFAAGLPLLILLLPTATFFGAGFFAAAFFATGFLTAAFLTATFFAATFLTAGLVFFGCGLATAFRATGLLVAFLPATFLLAATFFATALLAGLAVTRLAFAGALLAFFTIRPFVAAVFDLPALTTFALAAILPFCALAALELPVVFAISLHHDWP